MYYLVESQPGLGVYVCQRHVWRRDGETVGDIGRNGRSDRQQSDRPYPHQNVSGYEPFGRGPQVARGWNCYWQDRFDCQLLKISLYMLGEDRYCLYCINERNQIRSFDGLTICGLLSVVYLVILVLDMMIWMSL